MMTSMTFHHLASSFDSITPTLYFTCYQRRQRYQRYQRIFSETVVVCDSRATPIISHQAESFFYEEGYESLFDLSAS